MRATPAGIRRCSGACPEWIDGNAVIADAIDSQAEVHESFLNRSARSQVVISYAARRDLADQLRFDLLRVMSRLHLVIGPAQGLMLGRRHTPEWGLPRYLVFA